ncbi:hypothetical protein ACH4S8_37225 [Streptomyces sp. NPDC021080]|uniref:hypothetical protein n=1 Tax=Streptomyces sp. NPDC021080 TaxID=3365110 RepID=UPI0037A0455D
MGFVEQCSLPVTVRPLSEDEIEALTPDDEVLVPASDFQAHTGLLERAKVVAGRHGGCGGDKVRILTVYGSEHSVGAVYVPSVVGAEMRLINDSGARVSTTLFIPGLEAPQAVERLRKALRAEFGAGVVEVWNERSGPVRDIRWDVYEVRRDLVEVERAPYRVGNEPKRGRGRKEWVEVERRILASGVRDGHQHHYMGKERMGWSLDIKLHNPEISTVDTI